jgi:hypothetical protein
LLLLAAPGAAADYRAPKNPHYKQRKKAPTVVHITPIERLALGRWKPEVKLAVEVFAADNGKTSSSYDPEHPPVAVLPWEDAAVVGDLGELVFQRLVERAEFKFDDAWWGIVPLAYGRQRIRAAHEQFFGLSRTIWDAQPTYHQYWKGMLESYQQTCRKVDRKDCRIYLARLLKGFERDELIDYAKAVASDERQRPVAIERVPEAEGDDKPANIRRGLRELPEMKDLARLLLAAGFDVWIVDLESQQILDAQAPAYGIDRSRIVGIPQALFRSRITSKIEEPVPTRGGKIDAMVSRLGRPPVFAVGAGYDDKDILDYTAGLRLVLDRGDKRMAEVARKRGWLVQPAFGP